MRKELNGMFTEGQLVIYGGEGVCRIAAVGPSSLSGTDKTKLYYTLTPLTRSGTVNSQMVFEEGRQHTSLYETPFGELSVDIQTSILKHNLSERGGLLEIKYSIAVEHTVTGRNCFKIRVRRKH